MENYGSQSAASAGAIGIIFGIILVPFLIVSLISLIGMWKVYAKAGKPGWAVIIPIYSAIVLLEIVGKPIWWIFLLLVPCLNIIFAVWIINLLSKSYGQGEGFTVGLLLLPFVFFPVLGFGNYQYLGPSAKEAVGFKPFDASTDYKDPFGNPPPQA
jgi:ABC-type sulfate transport system permease subunit